MFIFFPPCIGIEKKKMAMESLLIEIPEDIVTHLCEQKNSSS
jgi:hypothetical protein